MSRGLTKQAPAYLGAAVCAVLLAGITFAAEDGDPDPHADSAARTGRGPVLLAQQPQFDLAIAQFLLLDSGSRRPVRQVRAGQRLIVWLRIQQSGGTPPRVYNYRLFVDGEADALDANNILPVNSRRRPIFGQGDVAHVSFSEPGEHRIRVDIDHHNAHRETNERNNSRTITVNVVGAGGADGEYNDVALGSGYVTSAGTNTDRPMTRVGIHERILFVVAVRNEGRRPLRNVVLDVWVDRRRVQRERLDLPAGSHRWLRLNLGSRNGYQFRSLGRHRIRAVLDPENRIREIDEGNNRVTRNVTVTRIGNLNVPDNRPRIRRRE